MFRRKVMTSWRAAIVLVTVAGGLTLPAGAADAAELDNLNDCFAAEEMVTVTGSGFTANTPVKIRVQDGIEYTKTADGDGALKVDVQAPKIEEGMVRRSFTVTATDTANAAGVSTVSMFVAKTRPVSNAPVQGNPMAATTWQFAGYTPRRYIYGHFRLRGRTVHTMRFGRAGADACGYLRTRARRVPVRPLRAGRWTLQIDQGRRYLRTRKPRYVVEFSIMRSPRLGR